MPNPPNSKGLWQLALGFVALWCLALFLLSSL